jgi:hypothetical protein
MSIEARCNCGAIKLEITGEPVAQFFCHCDDCQAVHGAAYVPVVMFPSETVKVVAGEIATYALKNNPRVHCPTCGTRLYAEPPGMGVKGVVASILPAGAFSPRFHVQCQHARTPLNDGLPHFKGYPAAFGGADDTVGW